MTETIEIELDQVRLTALTWGQTDGPLALLLHGFPDSAHTWRHLGPVLAGEGYRVVAPFTRGYAPSGIPRDGRADVGALVDDAVGIHTALGADDSAVLIGHDWGALTANTLAAHRDSPFRRVVSMAVPPLTALPLGETVRHLPGQARRSWYVGFNQLPFLPERSLDRLVPKLWRDWSPGYDATRDVALTLESLADPRSRRTALDYYRQLARPIRRAAALPPLAGGDDRRRPRAGALPARPRRRVHDRTLRRDRARTASPRTPRCASSTEPATSCTSSDPAEVADLVVEFLRR